MGILSLAVLFCRIRPKGKLFCKFIFITNNDISIPFLKDDFPSSLTHSVAVSRAKVFRHITIYQIFCSHSIPYLPLIMQVRGQWNFCWNLFEVLSTRIDNILLKKNEQKHEFHTWTRSESEILIAEIVNLMSFHLWNDHYLTIKIFFEI